MVKFLPSAVVIFIILCFACVLNAVESSPTSNNGDSPKDSADVVSPASSSKPSSGRFSSSAWSKEEKGGLKPNDDKNKEQDILLDEESSLWNMKKLFRYVESLFYAVNQNSDDSVDKSIGDLKIMMQNLVNNDLLDKSENNFKDEMQNSTNSDTLDKSLDDAKMQNRLNKRQPAENSKIKVQNSLDKNYIDKPENSMKTQTQNSANAGVLNKSENDREMQKTANDNALKKSSNDGKVQKSSNNDFPNDKQSTENSKSKTENSTDKDFMDKSENNKKTETQNLESSDTLTKSVTNEDIQNSATNTLSKSSDNRKMQKYFNRNPLDSTQQTENSKNNQQNSMNKGHLNTSSQVIKMQNSSNNDIQLESIPAVKNDIPKEDVTKIAVKDYEDCDTDEVKMDDCTTNNTEEVNENADDNVDAEDEDDTVENDMDKDENDMDNDENDMDDDENEDDYIYDTNNENDTNENDDEDDYVKENNYGDGGKLDTDNTNPQAGVTADKKAHDRSIILPKFIIKSIQDQQNYSVTQPQQNYSVTQPQQNYSVTQPPTSQFDRNDSNDNVTLEVTEFQSIPSEGKPSLEFQLSGSEFIDDYINNPQRKTPERENEQPSTTEVLISNENNTKSKIIPLQIPVFINNFEEDDRSLNTTPPVNENMKDRNMYFDQSQNTRDNLLSENNAFPPPIFNEGRKDSTPDKDFLDDAFPKNLKNTPSPLDKPVFSTQEDEKVNEIIPLNLFPFRLMPHLQQTLDVPQADYNVFSNPAALNFPNINFPVKTPHNDIPATNIYRPEIIVPIQMSPNKALENEHYLNDQYEKYNFRDEKSPGISNEKVQQFEQNQPIILQQDKLPNIQNIQYISKQGTPNTPDETTYFTNYQPEMPVNISNIEKPIQNTKMLPNYLISDALQPNPSFNEMYNQDSSPTNIGNSMDKIRSQDHSDIAKSENQINIDKTLNLQSDLLTFQDNFSEQQIQFPQSDIKTPLPQSEMNNKALSYETKISSEIFSTQYEYKNTEFLQTQNGTNSSKGLPHHSFSNTEKIQIKPKNQDSSSVISENMAAAKPLVISNKPFIDEHQKSTNFDESRGQEQRPSSSDSDSSNNGRSDKTSSRSYGVKYDDESKESKTLSNETDNEENEAEDDFINENNYNYENNTYEDEDEDDYLSENDEDDYAYENDQDDYADENGENDYADENDEDDYADENDQDDYVDENGEDDYADENDEDDYADENDEDDNADDQDDYANENDQDDYANENNYDDDEIKTGSNAQKPKKAVIAGKRTHESITASPKRTSQTISDQQSHSMTKSLKSQINNNDVIIPKAIKSHSITNEEISSPRSELISGEFNGDYMNNRSDKNSKKENEQMNSDGTINDATMQITQKSISSNENDAIELPETFKDQREPASFNQGENFNTILEYIYKYSNNPLFKSIRDEKNYT